MGRWSRKHSGLMALGLLLICSTFYRYWTPGSDGEVHYLDSEELVFGDSTSGERLYPAAAPKLTIIAIWNPGPSQPLYLPNFFASVAANPTIDVLFIKDDRHEIGCDAPLAPGIANLREVCLSSGEYWALHADFLCEQWGCTEPEYEAVLSKLYARRWGDRVHAFFRPFRHAIFARWLHPDTPHWGVCDMDTFLGNFERTFPWDEAGKYDMLFPSNPMDAERVLVYVPGHLAFFANAPHVTRAFMRFPQIATRTAFFAVPWMDSGAPDEAEWSHWAFTQSGLTFLRFPGLVVGQFHLSAPGAGTFSIENGGYWSASNSLLELSHGLMRAALLHALHEHAKRPRAPTFSDEGKEAEVQLREGAYDGFLWFPRQYAVDFDVPRELVTDEWYSLKKFLIRRERDGPITYRTERIRTADWLVLPPEAYTLTPAAYVHSPMLAHEALYNHFQVEKFTEWWKIPGLPERAIQEGEVLYVDKERGAWVWDSRGRVVFEATV